MVEAAPAASFEVAQPQFLFQFLIIAFDDPALFCQPDQSAETDAFGQIGHPVFSRFVFATRPLNQEPFQFSRLVEFVIAMGSADAHRGKAGAQGMA